MQPDFTPTEQTISLHGLGFIQVILSGNQRLHVWHPDLPRRKCCEHSSIHNHRFSFTSRVLVGFQVNVRVQLEFVKEGTHNLISHNGPRSEKGGRISYPVAEVNIHRGHLEGYPAGEEYSMTEGEYHETPRDFMDACATIIKKTREGQIHANSVCRKGVEFDQDFDRFQLSPDQLWHYVREVLGGTT